MPLPRDVTHSKYPGSEGKWRGWWLVRSLKWNVMASLRRETGAAGGWLYWRLYSMMDESPQKEEAQAAKRHRLPSAAGGAGGLAVGSATTALRVLPFL